MLSVTCILFVNECRSVREAALGFMGEMYCQTGNHLAELLKQFDIRPAQQREIDACFAEINPIQNTVNRANGEGGYLPTSIALPILGWTFCGNSSLTVLCLWQRSRSRRVKNL
jgi:hypothetical protein